jgi:hypothetical protein
LYFIGNVSAIATQLNVMADGVVAAAVVVGLFI